MIGCCCDPCEVFYDDFSVDNLATDWDDRSGTWTVTGGEVQTASSSALLVANTGWTSEAAAYADAEIQCANNADNARLVILYVDDDNYWFAEVNPGAANGTLQLFERAGGVNTQRGTNQTITGFTTSETVEVKLCYANDLIIAEAQATSFPARIGFTTTQTVAGTQAGVGTGSVTTRCDFLTFQAKKHGSEVDDCPRCISCILCDTGEMPQQVQVTVSGITDGSCGDCTYWNATFILEAEGQVSNSPATCRWTYTDPSPNCSGNFGIITLQLINLAGDFLQISISNDPFVDEQMAFSTSAAGSDDCEAWSSFAIPYSSQVPLTTICIDHAATATVTTL
jgi:hypothetical protein